MYRPAGRKKIVFSLDESCEGVIADIYDNKHDDKCFPNSVEASRMAAEYAERDFELEVPLGKFSLLDPRTERTPLDSKGRYPLTRVINRAKRVPSISSQIHEYLLELGGSLATPEEIAEAIGSKPDKVKDILEDLSWDGIVQMAGRKRWKINLDDTE